MHNFRYAHAPGKNQQAAVYRLLTLKKYLVLFKALPEKIEII
jgi:hypothetical protein